MKNSLLKSQLETITKKCKSIADVCRALDIRPAGGNYRILNRKIKQYEIDISHFTGQGWRKGHNTSVIKLTPMEEILTIDSNYQSNKLRKRLILEGYKKYECETCRNTEWNGYKIPLELDHVNGVNTDNRLENLKLICPNCHALTSTYRGRNRKKSALLENRKLKYNKSRETLNE